jgi:DNA processing protein
MRLVTLLDEEYPPQLLTIHQRPPFLLYRGQLDPRDAGGVAIVGTRKPTDRGSATARTIAQGLADRGVTVVSGLAAGIDTAAHSGALDAGGRTVAVIGTGLRRSYPAENAALQERIASDHLALSQFWPDAAPTKTSFPMRNAVMSGYAAATVVIEAAWKSGARMQARLALEHGRPVFLHESLLQHDWARDYLARGAVIVRSSDDVLAALDERLSPQVELVWS